MAKGYFRISDGITLIGQVRGQRIAYGRTYEGKCNNFAQVSSKERIEQVQAVERQENTSSNEAR